MMLAELRNESLAFFFVVAVVPSYSQFGASALCVLPFEKSTLVGVIYYFTDELVLRENSPLILSNKMSTGRHIISASFLFTSTAVASNRKKKISPTLLQACLWNMIGQHQHMSRILLLITPGTVFITCDNQITKTVSAFHKTVSDMKVPFWFSSRTTKPAVGSLPSSDNTWYIQARRSLRSLHATVCSIQGFHLRN